MPINLSLHYKLAIVPCKKTYQRPWALARWGNLSSKSYHVCLTLWENKERIGSSDNNTCLIPWCIMVQALVLGGMYVMCKQKVNEGEKCFSIQPLTKFHFTDYTAIYTDHLNDEWERPQVWLVTKAPFVKFMVSFSPSYLNNVCKIYDNNSFFAEHYLKTWLFFLLLFFFLPFYTWAGEQCDILEILLHVYEAGIYLSFIFSLQYIYICVECALQIQYSPVKAFGQSKSKINTNCFIKN